MQIQGPRLWLVRHGQTDWNAIGRIQGQTRTELNDLGRRQAADVGALLAKSGRIFSACYSSDIPRASQTADIIAQPLGLPVGMVEGLRERSFGEWEGYTTAQIRAKREELGLEESGDLANWYGVPGIESNDSLWKRTDSALREIAKKHPDQDVLVVTHGGVISRAVHHTLGIPEGTYRRFPLNNGIVVVLEFRRNSWYLVSLADLAFLQGGLLGQDTARNEK